MKSYSEIGGNLIPKSMIDSIIDVCSKSNIIDYACIFGSYLFGYEGNGSNIVVYLESKSMTSYNMLCSVDFHKLYANIRVSLCEYFKSVGKDVVDCEICYFGNNEIDFIRTTDWYAYIEETGYKLYEEKE